MVTILAQHDFRNASESCWHTRRIKYGLSLYTTACSHFFQLTAWRL